MIHRTDPEFWALLHRLPVEVQALAHKNFALLQVDSSHSSLQFKRVGTLWSARVGLHYRALAVDIPDEPNTLLWFWIGHHSEYDRILRNA